MHYRVNPEPVLALARAGLLRDGDQFIHCTHLNEEAWRVIKDTGGRVSLCPPLEMAMGHGMPAIQNALDRGVRPSLSSDHGTTVGQDMFTIMREAFNVQRLFVQQRMRANEPNLPPLLTCREVLAFATIASAPSTAPSTPARNQFSRLVRPPECGSAACVGSHSTGNGTLNSFTWAAACSAVTSGSGYTPTSTTPFAVYFAWISASAGR